MTEDKNCVSIFIKEEIKMKKAIIALLAVVALVGTSCSDITEVYDPVGFWGAVYVPGGFNSWLRDGGNNTTVEQLTTAATQITTTSGYFSTWTYETEVLNSVSGDGNRKFQIIPNEAKWSGNIGFGGIDASSTGVENAGDIRVAAGTVADGQRALIQIDQGLWDADNLVLAKPLVTVTVAP
jgi:hypothetical protein